MRYLSFLFGGSQGCKVGKDDVHPNARRRRRIRTELESGVSYFRSNRQNRDG